MRRFELKVGACAGLLTAAALGGGCQAITAIAGGMAASYERTGSHTVAVEYTGLRDNRVAVMVAADRAILSTYPSITAQLTGSISTAIVRETEKIGAKVIAPVEVLQYVYDNPRWMSKSYGDVAKQLGVQRIVLVDLFEFRLNEPGNQYLWGGVVAAKIGVIETDGPSPDEFAFTKDISVAFPDKTGAGPNDYTAEQVASVLRKRFVDRVSWLFFDHEEANIIKY